MIKRVVPAPGLFSEIQDKSNNGIPCFLPQLCPICTAIVTDDPKRHILIIGALVLLSMFIPNMENLFQEQVVSNIIKVLNPMEVQGILFAGVVMLVFVMEMEM